MCNILLPWISAACGTKLTQQKKIPCQTSPVPCLPTGISENLLVIKKVLLFLSIICFNRDETILQMLFCKVFLLE